MQPWGAPTLGSAVDDRELAKKEKVQLRGAGREWGVGRPGRQEKKMLPGGAASWAACCERASDRARLFLQQQTRQVGKQPL